MMNLRPTAEVNPSRETVEGLAARPDNNAIIMLNLLRFREPDGMEAYGRYGRVASGTVRSRGGFAPYTAAVVVPRETGWERVTLVRYPRRAAYLDMQHDPAYVGAIPDRTEGLAARLLYAFHDPSGDPDQDFAVESRSDDEAFVVSLVRLNEETSGANWQMLAGTVLDLVSDHAMVSDGLWDRLVVARYPSIEAASAHDSTTSPSVLEAIDLVTQPAGWSFPLTDPTTA